MDSLPKAHKKSEVARFYTNPNFEYDKSKILALEPMVLTNCFAIP